jgi:hypothetical protein
MFQPTPRPATRRFALAVAVLLPLTTFPEFTMASDAPHPLARTVSVSAQGSASAEPDVATISTGVQTEGETAREALSRNNALMSKVIDGLKAAGIAPRDVRTAQVAIYPRYKSQKGERPAEIAGYTASNTVTITLRDLKKLGEILDQSVTLGANQMGGIAFEVSQAETLRDDARKAAMTNARRRAELYAAAAGASLGPVVTISESIQMAGPRPGTMMRAAKAESSVPVEPGSQKLDVTVHVTYVLK